MFCSKSLCLYSHPSQTETPKGRFSVSSKELGSFLCSWDFSTCSCAPWMSSAVPSSWLEVGGKAQPFGAEARTMSLVGRD